MSEHVPGTKFLTGQLEDFTPGEADGIYSFAVVMAADYEALKKEFIDHMWWERAAVELQRQRDALQLRINDLEAPEQKSMKCAPQPWRQSEEWSCDRPGCTLKEPHAHAGLPK